MGLFGALVCSIIVGVARAQDFPKTFKFGAATAAYQVEGAWNVSDKSPSVWDELTHSHPEAVQDRSNGDVACDSYHLWRRDVEIAAELGLDFYRFSIAWTRLMPSGFSNHISEDGKKYYSDLIDALLNKGIEPVATLYHWDLPQSLQDLGGWANPLITEWFADYARVVFSLYADRVKTWITVNEPLLFCDAVYNMGIYAPHLTSPGIGNYLCSKNVLIAHAKAWRLYDKQFKPGSFPVDPPTSPTGKAAMTVNLSWLETADGGDEATTELARLAFALYSHPIYSKEGGWPKAIEETIRRKSKEQGYPQSRLPALSAAEIDLIKGTYDFFGFNFYTGRTVRKAKKGEAIGSWPFGGSPDLDFVLSVRPNWILGSTEWGYWVPGSLRHMLNGLKGEYGNLDIFIIENGFAGFSGLNDTIRLNYIKESLEQVHQAIYVDGINVVGFTTWSLLDNFEWSDGYKPKFGLYEVDFSSPTRPRKARASARYYAEVISRRSLNVSSHYHFYHADEPSSGSSISSFAATVFFGCLYAYNIFVKYV